MIESTNQEIPEMNKEMENSFLQWVIFTAKGFVFSCGSKTFYREASKKKLILAILFFFIFAFIVTSITTIQVGIGMVDAKDAIQGAYERGEVPTIIIKDGEAQVDGPQPLVFEQNRQIFAIDTTGEIKEINTQLYSEGLLLTRTEVHFVNEDGYQAYPLSDLNETFGNPIIIDKTQALNWWETASVWIMLLAFVGLLLWNFLVRFIYIVFIGLMVWGIVSIKKTGVDFSLILIAGVYANVPVIYLKYLLSLVNINFFSLYTILLVLIWGLALRIVLKEPEEIHSIVSSDI